MLHKVFAVVFVWPVFCGLALFMAVTGHTAHEPRTVPLNVTHGTSVEQPYKPLVNPDLDAKIKDLESDTPAAKEQAKEAKAAQKAAEKATKDAAKAAEKAEKAREKAAEKAAAKAEKEQAR